MSAFTDDAFRDEDEAQSERSRSAAGASLHANRRVMSCSVMPVLTGAIAAEGDVAAARRSRPPWPA